MKNTDRTARNVRHIQTAPSAAPVAPEADQQTAELGIAAAPVETDREPTGHDATTSETAEQLTLLTVERDVRAHRLPTTAHREREVHARFRLNKRTREIGLQHVAEIRRQLEEAKAARAESEHPRLPRRRPAA